MLYYLCNAKAAYLGDKMLDINPDLHWNRYGYKTLRTLYEISENNFSLVTYVNRRYAISPFRL
jgi:hypothetical protein